MNSQIVEIKNAFKSKFAFTFLAALIPASLFLKPGFVSVSVLWFFTLCIYNSSSFEWHHLKTKYLLLLPIILYLFYGLGLFYSHDLDAGLDIAFRKIHLLLLPLAFMLAGKRMNKMAIHRPIFAVFLLCCILASVLCLVNALVTVVTEHGFGIQRGSIYYHYFYSHLLTKPLNITPVYVSLFSNFALLIALTSTLIKNIWHKVTTGFYLVIFIVLCGPNAGIVCAAITVILWLISIGNRWVFFGLTAFIATAILFTLIHESSLQNHVTALLKFTYSNEQDELSDYAANRFLIWESAIEVAKERPAIGYGTGDGQMALEDKFKERNLTNELTDSLNAHNEFLSTILDVGLIGFFIVVIMVTAPFILAIRTKDVLAIGFFLMIAAFFSIESILLRQKGIVFFAFFYGVIILHLLKEYSHTDKKSI